MNGNLAAQNPLLLDINDPDIETQLANVDYNFKNLGRIDIKAQITDSTDSIFTPCSYRIEPLKIISSPTNQQQISLNRINEVCSFRGRFCEQAVKDEIVLIKGKLEKVKYKDEQEYFRILLENQVTDKMSILT